MTPLHLYDICVTFPSVDHSASQGVKMLNVPVVFTAPDTKAEAAVPSEEEAPTPADAPVIMLGPLENKSCVDELSDGVQSMDVR